MDKLPEFVEFPKMARLSRESWFTEKIDGTNACVFIDDYGDFFTGSRTRWITPQDDNFGFARWAEGHKAELLTLGPGQHFGEWWGSGIQRGYGLAKGEKRFSLFNVGRWIKTEADRVSSKQEIVPECCYVVPVLWRGIFGAKGPFEIDPVDAVLDLLRLEGSKAAPGFKDPEGIVIYHTAAGISFKKTLGNDGHKTESKCKA